MVDETPVQEDIQLSQLCFLPCYAGRKHEVEDAVARLGLTGKIRLLHIVFKINDVTLTTEHLAFKPIDDKLIFVYSLKGWDHLADEIMAETNRKESANG